MGNDNSPQTQLCAKPHCGGKDGRKTITLERGNSFRSEDPATLNELICKNCKIVERMDQD